MYVYNIVISSYPSYACPCPWRACFAWAPCSASSFSGLGFGQALPWACLAWTSCSASRFSGACAWAWEIRYSMLCISVSRLMVRSYRAEGVRERGENVGRSSSS